MRVVKCEEKKQFSNKFSFSHWVPSLNKVKLNNEEKTNTNLINEKKTYRYKEWTEHYKQI